MSHRISVRVTADLAAWLAEASRRSGLPTGCVVRQLLERAKAQEGTQRFLRHAGKIAGTADLSKRTGFSRA